MSEAPHELPDRCTTDELSCDSWLGGKLTLAQPRRGHRVGSDAALLAAAVDLAGGRLVDVGAGVGAVGLAIVRRGARNLADFVEIDTLLAEIAAGNAGRNGLADRVRVAQADIFDPSARRAAGLADEAADLVVTNPPFFESGAVRASPDSGRARAHVFADETGGAPLVGWIRACLALLRPGGQFALIHRPDRARRDPGRGGEPARGDRDPASASSRRRVGASLAGFGRKGVEGPPSGRPCPRPA